MFRLLRQQIKNASIILPTLLFAASQFAGYASAADESAFELPDWRFKFVKKVEYDNPQLGYSNRYESAKAKIDEYFYYRGFPDNPELLKRHFGQIIKSFDIAVKRGIYKEVKIHDKGEIKIGGLDFQYAYMRIKGKGGLISNSFLFMAILNNEVLKYRVTTRHMKIVNDDVGARPPNAEFELNYSRHFISKRLKDLEKKSVGNSAESK